MAKNDPTSLSTATDIASWCPHQTQAHNLERARIAARRLSHIGRRRRCHARCQAARAVLVCGAILLASCQALNPPLELKETDAAGSAIRFQHADFQPELAEYAVQRDPRTGGKVHLASFHGPDSIATLAAIRAGPGYVVQERSIESVVPDLMPANTKIVWGARGGAMSGVGYTQYRLFEIADQPLSCVGFAQTEGTSDDSGNRPNAVFGYFCRDESREMTPQSAEELLAQVKLGRGG
jgi:hypothetical protein